MTVTKGWHCDYEIHYRIVFPVKYLKALRSAEIVSELILITRDIQDRYDIVFDQKGADRDHIHLVCSVQPKFSPGEIVGKYKSITARELFAIFPHLKKDLWGGEFWSDDYYVASVGQRNNWETVFRYVKNQGQQPAQTLRRFDQLSLPGM